MSNTRRSADDDEDSYCPRLKNPEWETLAAPVLESIHAAPCDSNELRSRFQQNGDFVDNATAWLAIHGKIENTDGKWRVI